MSETTYPLYGLVLSSILDRACLTALTSLPEARIPYIEKVLREISMTEPDDETISVIENATRQDEDLSFSDDSGELFLRLFTANIIKLSNMVYKAVFKDSSEIVSMERTIYSVCESLSRIDPGIHVDFSPYDDKLREKVWVSHEGWLACALVNITASNIIRSNNANLDDSDLNFCLRLAEPIKDYLGGSN